MFRLISIVGTGSFVDGVSRFLTSRFIKNQAASTFPPVTFVTIILDYFEIGPFYGFSKREIF